MIYIVLAMLLYTTALMFGVIASRNANTNLSTTIINLVSGLIPLAVIMPTIVKRQLEGNKTGIIASVLCGIGIALYVMALQKAYSQNNVAIVAPVVFGGAIFLSAILSFLFFKERILPVQGIGLILLVIGLGLVVYSRATGK